jgi:hypothetical protein
MQTIKINLDMTINIPDNENISQIKVVEELLNKLYVGVEHYQDDVFSVSDIHLKSFEVQ